MVYDVLTFMKKEAEEGLQYDLKAVTKRTAAATGVAERTVRRIASVANNASSDLSSAFRTPGKKRSGTKRVTGIDSFDQGVIKRCIHNFHITEKEFPTIGQILKKLKADINFQGSATSLTRILNELGFKWKKTENNRKVLIEHTNIRLKRIEYLKKIMIYREEGRPIIYTDESYVDFSHTTSKACSDGSTEDLKKNISKGPKLVIAHAWSESGFLPNALLMFKAGTKSSDCHQNMNYENYEKWLRTQLMPNLPPNSVVVVDNAPYHNKLQEKVLTSNSKKSKMVAWLMSRDIPFSSNMYKPELYKLILTHKESYRKYNIDRILSECNHTVLRLPPYHPELNPIKMAWASIKDYVARKNTNLSLNKLMKLVEEKVNAMGESDWKVLCTKVKTIEEEYKKNDRIIDKLTDEFILCVSENESDESETDFEDEEEHFSNEEVPYTSETTVSNEVLDTVLKAGEVLKIRGLWRQTDDASGDTTTAEKTATQTPNTSVNKQTIVKKPEEIQTQPKIAVKKDDKLLKAFNPVQSGSRPMFIGPPKLVFIKTTEGGTQAAIRPGAPKGQTILVAPAPAAEASLPAIAAPATPATTVTVAATAVSEDSSDEPLTPRILRRHAERKYGKRQKTEQKSDNEELKDCEETQDSISQASKKSTQSSECEVQVKDEPEWDASSIEEEERSIAEMFQAEMSVKTEPADEVDIEEESLMYSPLACELCAEVFTVPAAWVRHVQAHARNHTTHARKRKLRSASDDTEETMALLRCDLCQKHFPNPAEWVRHIQSTHTESELAISNNSAPPKRHNRFTEGAQNKTCTQCKKTFPSHASMLIHMRTHTGERPFVCGLCNKGFNVKSNLLRHLRTLHDQLISPTQVDEGEEEEAEPGPSEVKRES